MKINPLLIVFFILFTSCNSMLTNSNSDNQTKFHRKRIAVLPFQIHTSIEELPEGVTLEMVNKKEKEKSNLIQLHLYRYMLREYAKSSRKVILQSYNDTNAILKKKGIAHDEIFQLPKNKLARILKVDAIVYGNVYQSKKKILIDGKEELKNKRSNSISTVIYVYGRSKKERLLWKDDRAGAGFPSEYAPEMTKNLLRKAAKEFPF